MVIKASTDIYSEELDFAGLFCNGYAIVGKYEGLYHDIICEEDLILSMKGD